jgi:hypothetical protein
MVYLTLTTIPSRLNSSYNLDIKECLNTLLNQTHNNYEIHLNIPSKLKYTGEEYIIPDWLLKLQESNSKLKVFSGLEDMGPATKLYHTVQRITNPEDIIIVVDDDLLYDSRLVEEQVNNQKKFIGAVVGYDGINSVDNFQKDIRDYFCSGINEHNKVKVLQHYKSISYKRKYFEDDFNDFVLSNLSWNDDVLMSAYFASKYRDRIATFHPDDPVFTTEDRWRETVGTSFPIKGHTQHERKEGCNLYREEKVDDKHQELYKIIDRGYFEDRFRNLQTVIYTNDLNIGLAEIACTEYKKYAPLNSVVTIVTNKISENFQPSTKHTVFSAEIENKKGKQFAGTMLKYLNTINSEFILFLLDDYITYRNFSQHDFNRLLKLLEDYNVDYFSFDRKQEQFTRNFKSFKNDLYDEEYINIVDSSDIHRFSVQPCIWRRTSLINILEKYPDLDIHTFETDPTIVNESLLTLGFNWHVFDPKIPSTEGFEHHFVFSAVEVGRHGVFMIPENGQPRSRNDFPCQTVYNLIETYNLRSKPNFKHLLGDL